MNRSRKLSLLATLATILSTFGLFLVGQGTAQAHGVAQMPGSRTWLCYEDAKTASGALTPTNPACAAAVAQSGTTSLYNWFAVLDSNAGGKGQGYVPDGTICSAGNKSPYDFSGYNAARSDWPRTHLTSGASIQFQYSDWAKHPGTFRVYVTKQGWSPTTPLAWADLEQIGSVTDPPADGGPGTDAGHYYWTQALPSGRSGNALIFIQWVRSDSNENFFSCSDVAFDGGHGEVTGINGSSTTGGTTTAGTTSGTTTAGTTSGTTSGTTTSGTTSGTTTAGTTSGTTSGTTTAGTTSGTTTAGTTSGTTSGTTTAGTTSGTTGGTTGSCMAQYSVTNSWGGGFQGQVEVMNHGTAPISKWTVSWTTASGTQITSLWNGTLTGSSGAVTVTNAAYNGTIAANSSTTFGFTANSTGNNLPNGSITCSAS
ncbi:lytic polysaccharide monooxygenase [Streptacidiphilus griseoplanus]|uniref:lytic polysaccharide monooxygenase n=1 Tax=Peterkaempfera griseoplana TaxID=66896 RepID=UPI0006E1BCD8|nr:lytic polysaccharide monooxygenase [Peterkaempfera griseoplana]